MLFCYYVKTNCCQVTPEVRNSRLKRFTVPLEAQGEFESVRLWRHVSKAIGEDDQVGATEEKSKLEEEQRAGARERKATGEEWTPRLFELDPANVQSEQYEYRHADLRPWDDLNDQHQFERGFVVCTKTRHKTPMIRKVEGGTIYIEISKPRRGLLLAGLRAS